MSQVLNRRMLVAVAILALVASAYALAVAARPEQAQAQTGFARDTEVIANIVNTTNSRGEIHLGPGTGSNDSIGASCAPAGPRGGPDIPGQLVSDYTRTEMILRAFRINGSVLANRTIRFSCTVDFGDAQPTAAATAAVTRLRSLQQK
jgi:hypothetical protein